MCTGKLAEDKELGGISEGGQRKGPWAVSGRGQYYPNSNSTELSDLVAAVWGLEPTPPFNEHAIWSQQPDQKKKR